MKQVISALPCASFSKQAFMKKLSHENTSKFNLHEFEPVGWTHVYVNDFTQRLVWKHREKTTQKWPIWIMAFGVNSIQWDMTKDSPRDIFF